MKSVEIEIKKDNMKSPSNLVFYAVIISVFLLLKVGYSVAENDDLIFLLKPITEFIELSTGTNSVYNTNSGFYFEQLDVLIDKSCSGGNFLLLCFAMLSFLALKHISKPYQKLIAIVVVLFISYLVAIGVNVSRIYVSLILESEITQFLNTDNLLVHEAIGVTTNLSFLILIYILFDKLIQTYSYAKLT